MGPEVNAAASVVNDVLPMYLLIGIGLIVVAVALSFAADRVAVVARRRRGCAPHEDPCSAFAEAVARGDLDAAEAFASLAFARLGASATTQRGASAR